MHKLLGITLPMVMASKLDLVLGVLKNEEYCQNFTKPEISHAMKSNDALGSIQSCR